ncbi:hypothetical protein RB25_17355 [Herbaspirillum rubrisubalbicans]|nr:hypothetical protein RB25_17355 [Herbaspirillum rubrisubalbicans]
MLLRKRGIPKISLFMARGAEISFASSVHPKFSGNFAIKSLIVGSDSFIFAVVLRVPSEMDATMA